MTICETCDEIITVYNMEQWKTVSVQLLFVPVRRQISFKKTMKAARQWNTEDKNVENFMFRR